MTHSTLYPNATASDLREAANACRWHDRELALYLLADIDFPCPEDGESLDDAWLQATVEKLEAEADRIDPPPPSSVYYTTAPEAFDGFGTRTLDPEFASDGPHVVRKVLIQDAHARWQTERYASGWHCAVTEAELPKFANLWTRTKAE